jgi:hypothetical protein
MPIVFRNSHRFLYLLLLPVFFIGHGVTENFGMVTPGDCIRLLLTYLVAGIIIFAAVNYRFRNPAKSGLLTFLLFFIYFFFGSGYDFLKDHHIFLYKYRVLLPLLLLTVIIAVIAVTKAKHDFPKLRLLLTWILLLSIIADLIRMVPRIAHPTADRLSVYGSERKGLIPLCGSCPTPDIYLLLFDEYASTASLRNDWHFDNSVLDSFLLHEQFYLQRRSSSNYNFTPFSMASMLNMNYLQHIADTSQVSINDYAACNQLIRNNEVIRYLSALTYEIVNYSIFDLAGHPAEVSFSLLPVKTRLITAQTLFNRIERDLAWNLEMGPVSMSWLSKRKVMENRSLNAEFENGVMTTAREKSNYPRFVYAHFEMPHPPYYYDKNLHPRSLDTLLAELTGNHPASYTGYLPYVNQHLMKLVSDIRKYSHDSAVIIIMGDHGYRATADVTRRAHYFSNLSAVYFPDHNYRLLNDSSSAVNQFRMVFNSLFRQSMPLLKDSSVFLVDANPRTDN